MAFNNNCMCGCSCCWGGSNQALDRKKKGDLLLPSRWADSEWKKITIDNDSDPNGGRGLGIRCLMWDRCQMPSKMIHETFGGRSHESGIGRPPLPHRRTVTSMNQKTKVRAYCGRRRPGSSATENPRFTRRTTALYHSPTLILGCSTKAGATTITRHTQSKIYAGRAALITSWNTTESRAGRHVFTRLRCKVYVNWHEIICNYPCNWLVTGHVITYVMCV